MSDAPLIITAAPVPFDTDGKVAFPTFEALLNRIEPYVDQVFVSGTTAEFPALSSTERGELLRLAVAVFGVRRVVAHVGAASLSQVMPLAEDALTLGVRQLACLTPYFLPADFAGVHAWFASLASLPGAAVFVYLFPERSGIEVTPSQLGELTAIDGVVGAKLSGSPNECFGEYVAAAGAGARLYSGDDAALPSVMAAGGVGVVSGVSSAFPERFARLRDCWAARSPNRDAAQRSVVDAVRLVGPTIPRLKTALALRHHETWECRMTMGAVTADTAQAIASLVDGSKADEMTAEVRK